ncbi:MAG TPA: tetratricopeptide repeat protein [Opitutaceae bacterium]|jgi:Flp pilus assembly protein TadD|nr:tetratricopeptide repeat protein [Opitutaceae bacterium]
MPPTANRNREWLWPLAIAAAVIVAYLPLWHAGFIWDDNAHVTPPDLASLRGLGRIWFHLGATQQYYPVLYSAFWVQHQVWGADPLGYHLVNLALHIAAAILAGTALRRLGVQGAWWIAAAFALHPINVETVAWVSEQKNTLSAVFGLLAVLGFLRWREKGGGVWYAGATLAFVCSLLSKSVTATLPAALFIVLWWRRRRPPWREAGLPLLPWLVLGAAIGLFTAWVEKTQVGASGALFALSPADRLLIAGRALWFYAAKTAWPFHLLFEYPRWHLNAGSAAQWLFPLAAFGVIAGLAAARRWGALTCVLYFAGTLFPALGFVNVYPFVFSFVADHFQYLAGLGLFALLAAAGRRLPLAAGLALLAAWGVLTFRQSGEYRDMETIFTATLRGNPDSWMAHDNLGMVLASRGDLAGAIAHYRESIRLQPNYPEAYNNLGNALAREGQLADAEEQYEAALRARPSFALGEVDWASALNNSGNYVAAALHYERALKLKPDYPEAELGLGNALANNGETDAAIAHYHAALRLRPHYPAVEANLGLALVNEGHLGEAQSLLEDAVRREPQEAEFHAYLGLACAKAGRLEQAVQEFRASLRLHPRNPDVHYQLGLVLQALGRTEEAQAELRQANAP